MDPALKRLGFACVAGGSFFAASGVAFTWPDLAIAGAILLTLGLALLWRGL